MIIFAVSSSTKVKFFRSIDKTDKNYQKCLNEYIFLNNLDKYLYNTIRLEDTIRFFKIIKK